MGRLFTESMRRRIIRKPMIWKRCDGPLAKEGNGICGRVRRVYEEPAEKGQRAYLRTRQRKRKEKIFKI